MSIFSNNEISERLKQLPGWEFKNQVLHKEFVFPTFTDAMIFVNEIAQASEDLAHHPDIALHHNCVTLSTTTGDIGGVTEIDFQLAQKAQEAEKTVFGEWSKA